MTAALAAPAFPLVPRSIAKSLRTAREALAAGRADTARRAMVYAASCLGLLDLPEMAPDFRLRLLSQAAEDLGVRRARERDLFLRNAEAV
jgi:hypothetical protein